MERHRSDDYWLPALLVLGLLLTGCDQNGNGSADSEAAQEAGQAQQTDQGSGEESSVQTYTPDVDEPLEAMGDRLPAAEGRTALIPATDLFPGTARVSADIKNPYAGDQQAIERGRQHFMAFNCAGCHAPLGGGGMGPPLSDDAWIYGSNPGQVYISIMQGRPEGMPAWGSMLPAKTTWELVAYIDTLDEIEDYAAEKDFDENESGFREETIRNEGG